jgi:hypothetical protein
MATLLPPTAVLVLLLPLALAFTPNAELLEFVELLALDNGPQAALKPPAAVALAPSAVAGPTVAPVALPTQTNCAAAGRGPSETPAAAATMAQPANSAVRRRPSTIDMTLLRSPPTDVTSSQTPAGALPTLCY